MDDPFPAGKAEASQATIVGKGMFDEKDTERAREWGRENKRERKRGREGGRERARKFEVQG